MIVSAIVFGLLWKQEMLIYVPAPHPVHAPRYNQTDPKKYANLPYEDVFAETEDGIKVHGWLIKQRNDNDTINVPTILYFHGNAGNIAIRLPLLLELYRSCGINILVADYRGFGSSDDAFINQAGLEKDAFAFYKAMTEHKLVNKNKMFLFGRSLGAAASIHLMSRLEQSDKYSIKFKGLIIENTFSSLKSIATVLLPFLRPVENLLHPPFLRDVWENDKKILDIKNTPVMFISGRSDELIPVSQIDELIQLHNTVATTPDVVHKVPNGKHNDTPMVGGISYYARLNDFMNSCLN